MPSTSPHPLQVPRILWAALTGSALLFPVLLVVIRSSGGDVPDGPPDFVLLPAFGAAALGSVTASFVVPTLQRKQAFGRLRLETREVPDDTAMPMYGQQATRKVIADRARALSVALPAYQTGFILTMALREAVATFGFVLGMVGFDLVVAAPFFAIAVLLMLIEFPSEDRILAELAKVHGVGLPS